LIYGQKLEKIISITNKITQEKKYEERKKQARNTKHE
jgi:hypothetical protein